MSIIEAFRTAWTALQTNKLRSLLTMLGIIIGVGAVVGLLAIGNGFQSFLDQEFAGLGVGVFYVYPFVNTRNADVRLTAQLTSADGVALLQPGAAPAVKAISFELYGGGTVSAGHHHFFYDIRGVSASHFTISQNTLGAGRYYYDIEDQNGARVAVIGEQVAQQLFGGVGTAVGQEIMI